LALGAFVGLDRLFELFFRQTLQPSAQVGKAFFG
jgi:hypothetical protein